MSGSSPFPPDCAEKFAAIRRLAAGGFGAVWLATHRELERPAAVKILTESALEGADSLARFSEEALITASLRHPNIVQVLDHGAESGVPWIAYEFLEGQSLRERLEAGPLLLDTALEAIRQVAEGLQAAHARGILHRDVKPDNVLWIRPSGSGEDLYKLVDFGIAKWAREGAVETQSGLVLGTPAYLPPERIRGEAAGAPSDVYALGIMLFELLAGHPPYCDESPGKVLEAHLRAPVPSLRAMRPSIPVAVDRLIARTMAKSILERPVDAGALVAELAALTSTVSAVSRSGSTMVIRGRREGTPPVASRTLRLDPPRGVAPSGGPAHPHRRAVAAGAAIAGGLLLAAAFLARTPGSRDGDHVTDITNVSPSAGTHGTSSSPDQLAIRPLPRHDEMIAHHARIQRVRGIYEDLGRIPDLDDLVKQELQGTGKAPLSIGVVTGIVERFRLLLEDVRDEGRGLSSVLPLEACGYNVLERLDRKVGPYLVSRPEFAAKLREVLDRLWNSLHQGEPSGRVAVLRDSLGPLIDKLRSPKSIADSRIQAAPSRAADRLEKLGARRGWTFDDRCSWILLTWRSLEISRSPARKPADRSERLAALAREVVPLIRGIREASGERLNPDQMQCLRTDMGEVFESCTRAMAALALDDASPAPRRREGLELLEQVADLIDESGVTPVPLRREAPAIRDVIERLDLDQAPVPEALKALKSRFEHASELGSRIEIQRLLKTWPFEGSREEYPVLDSCRKFIEMVKKATDGKAWASPPEALEDAGFTLLTLVNKRLPQLPRRADDAGAADLGDLAPAIEALREALVVPAEPASTVADSLGPLLDSIARGRPFPLEEPGRAASRAARKLIPGDDDRSHDRARRVFARARLLLRSVTAHAVTPEDAERQLRDWMSLVAEVPRLLADCLMSSDGSPAPGLARRDQELPGLTHFVRILMFELARRACRLDWPAPVRRESLDGLLDLAVSLGGWTFLEPEDFDRNARLLGKIEAGARPLTPVLDENRRQKVQYLLAVQRCLPAEDRRTARLGWLNEFETAFHPWRSGINPLPEGSERLEGSVVRFGFLVDAVPGVEEWEPGAVVVEPDGFDLLEVMQKLRASKTPPSTAVMERWRPALEALRARLRSGRAAGEEGVEVLDLSLGPVVDHLLGDSASVDHLAIARGAREAAEALAARSRGGKEPTAVARCARSLLLERSALHYAHAAGQPPGAKPELEALREEAWRLLSQECLEAVETVRRRSREDKGLHVDPLIQYCPTWRRLHENTPVFLAKAAVDPARSPPDRRETLVTLIRMLDRLKEGWWFSELTPAHRIAVAQVLDQAVASVDPPLDGQDRERLERVHVSRRKHGY